MVLGGLSVVAMKSCLPMAVLAASMAITVTCSPHTTVSLLRNRPQPSIPRSSDCFSSPPNKHMRLSRSAIPIPPSSRCFSRVRLAFSFLSHPAGGRRTRVLNTLHPPPVNSRKRILELDQAVDTQLPQTSNGTLYTSGHSRRFTLPGVEDFVRRVAAPSLSSLGRVADFP